jgi:hypothetical protein
VGRPRPVANLWPKWHAKINLNDPVLGVVVNIVTERVMLCALAYGLEPKNSLVFRHVFSRGGFMLADGEAEVIQEQLRARYPKLVHRSSYQEEDDRFLVVATWLLSIVFGVAFWALLFHSILLR